MLKWITCYLSGRHDYIVSCEPGTIFLKCNHCGRRSNGWELQHGAILRHDDVKAGQPSSDAM